MKRKNQFNIKDEKLTIYGNHKVTDSEREAKLFQAIGYEVMGVLESNKKIFYIGDNPLWGFNK